MQNLRVDEGGDVLITNAHGIPRGIYCRLQPEETEFLDLAAEIGPKVQVDFLSNNVENQERKNKQLSPC